MKRRQFIKTTAPAAILPFFMGGFSIKAFGESPVLSALTAAKTDTDHVLVLIQLNGGNDGLNTIIPLDQYSNLSKARSNILIDEKKVLKLYNSSVTGFHPAMKGLQNMYNDGKMAVVQSVGYPNPNFSHFRATDIWLTASDADKVEYTGWLGRYLAEEYADYPKDYPNKDVPDPLALQIGSIVSTGFQGPKANMGMAISSATDFYQLVSGTFDPAPNTPAGHELTFIRQVTQQTNEYAEVIKAAAAKASNKSKKYPAAAENPLADQLKIVAQLIAGGLQTRIYVVNLNGFDTHSQQVPMSGGTETGAHAALLSMLSVAIDAFQDDIKLLGVEDRVLGMTFSEFGRRIKSNASLGTDHGSAAPLLLFGSKVKSGFFGTNPEIPDDASVEDNLPMQYDFRSVYASVLKYWFGVGQEELENVLLKDFQKLPLFDTALGFADGELNAGSAGFSNIYPNPFSDYVNIRFQTSGGNVKLSIFDSQGREVQTLVNGNLCAGEHQIRFLPNEIMSAGTYYCRLQLGVQQTVKSILYIKP